MHYPLLFLLTNTRCLPLPSPPRDPRQHRLTVAGAEFKTTRRPGDQTPTTATSSAASPLGISGDALTFDLLLYRRDDVRRRSAVVGRSSLSAPARLPAPRRAHQLARFISATPGINICLTRSAGPEVSPLDPGILCGDTWDGCART